MCDMLEIKCSELRELAELYPDELEVIIEMLIDADSELCVDDSAGTHTSL